MAKKLVRGITNVKTINNQDFDTNNVNDLLSDGEHNYIHRKKGKNEEYHNLTDNIKTISSDNTELLAVTNNNKTTNSATLHPKHDTQKEQVLESTRNTITINHGANGTTEKTKVDTNPEKVLEHDNLTVGNGLTKEHTGNTTNLSVDPVKVLEHDNLVSDSEYVTITHNPGETTSHIQTAKLKEDLDDLYANKQDLLVAGNGITIQGNTISALGGLTPQHQSYGTRGNGYYVFKEVFGMRTTYTIEVVQGEPEVTVVGDLKTDLVSKLANVSKLTNGAITLTYDGSNVKIITNTSPANGVEQATFTFYNS